MLFNMDASHMAISAPGISELLEQIVCFWLIAHFSLLFTTMYFLEKITSKTILGKASKNEKVNSGYPPTYHFFYTLAFEEVDIETILAKSMLQQELTCLDKALKAHTLVLPAESKHFQERKYASPDSVKEDRLSLLENLSQFSS